jgi:hypothetical protein
VSNGAEYDRALVHRGDITRWLSADVADSWTPGASRKRGGQRKFSDQAIETALVLQFVFQLPFRQAEGFLRSVLSRMALDLEAPDHTTISRRSRQVDVGLRLAATQSRLDLIDSIDEIARDATMLSVAEVYARHGQESLITPFILAGLAVIQLVHPGAPVHFGSFASSMSMQSGEPTFGTAEAAQTLFAGTHCVLHAAGWLEGGLAMGYEKFITDADRCASGDASSRAWISRKRASIRPSAPMASGSRSWKATRRPTWAREPTRHCLI